MAIPEPTDMLRELVASPSVSCTDPSIDQSNLGVVNQLAGWLEELDFQVDVLPMPDKPGKANLIATRGDGEEAGLALCGHTDTVPYDEALWQFDPFQVTERDSRLYGLGTADMKGFFPLALGAAARHGGSRLKRPLTIIATADEETSMDGARFLAERGIGSVGAAVIGEPTGMRPVRAHKGVAMVAIDVAGSAGHSSNPALGINALDAMHDVMAEIIAFRRELAQRNVHLDFEVPTPTLNLGCLHAGDNPNRICGHAQLLIDLRVLPGMDAEEVIDALRARVQGCAGETDVTVEPMFRPLAPFETAPEGRLVQDLEGLSRTACGTVAFGTEAPFYSRLGVETVVFGAGSIDQAHQPNEYLETAQIPPMLDILTTLIARHCL